MDNFSFIIAKLLRRVPFLSPVSKRFNEWRHTVIMHKIAPICKRALKESNAQPTSPRIVRDIIWCFWWQGQGEMPLLVQKCYRSILKHRGHYEVRLITKDNIRTYANLGNHVYEKVRHGKISLTHLSDILRFNLLSQYGGLWMDVTLYVVEDLDRIKVNGLYTCSSYPDPAEFNVAVGRWTGFLIGGPGNLKVFKFMDAFFKDYWNNNQDLIDYFLIDYALNYCWEHNISQFKQACINGQGRNPNLFNLQPLLNCQYDEKVVEQLTADTFIFKLSIRQKINVNDKRNVFNHLETLG